MKTYKNLKERMLTLNKKGVNAMGVATILLGLYIAVQFIVILLPEIITNLTDVDIGGGFGALFSRILPLLIIFGIFLYIAKQMGLKMGGGK